MDGEEIDRITHDIAPLDGQLSEAAERRAMGRRSDHRFAFRYLEAPAAVQRFLHSPLINAIWPETLN